MVAGGDGCGSKRAGNPGVAGKVTGEMKNAALFLVRRGVGEWAGKKDYAVARTAARVRTAGQWDSGMEGPMCWTHSAPRTEPRLPAAGSDQLRK